jgi:hypothetical protein
MRTCIVAAISDRGFYNLLQQWNMEQSTGSYGFAEISGSHIFRRF